MNYNEWAKKVEKEQGVSLEEAMEAMRLPVEYLTRWEKSGKVPSAAVKFANGLLNEVVEAAKSAPTGELKGGNESIKLESSKTPAKQTDKFGLNAALNHIIQEKLLAQNLFKTFTKADCNDLSAQAVWLDDDHYRIVISVTSASGKIVFRGDNAYSLSGFIYVKLKEALNKDEDRSPVDIEKALASMSGREVRVNGEVVFSD